MNAPAQVAAPRDVYIPVVRNLMPGASGEELSLRCSLLLIRDNATAALTRCSDEAHAVLQNIEHLAALYAFKAMRVEQIEQLRYQLLRLTTCASGLDQFAFALMAPTPGGQDAGGE